MATRRRVRRKNLVNSVSDMQRRISYVEKLPTKRTIADGGITSGKLSVASVSKSNVTFGVVKPLSEKPPIGSQTQDDADTLYIDTDPASPDYGGGTYVPEPDVEVPFVDSVAQTNVSIALTTANGKNKVFHQDTIPTNAQLPAGVTIVADDIWFDTATGNRPCRYLSQKTVTNKQLVSKVATLTTSANHGFSAGDIIYVNNVGAPFNGTFTITSVPTLTTLTYGIDAGNVSSTSSSGTVDGWRPYGYSSVAITSIDASVITSGILRGRTLELNGGVVTFSTKNVVSKSYLWGTAQLETDVPHGLEIGTDIIVSGLGAPFDGTFTISRYEGPFGTTIQYELGSPETYDWLPLTADTGTVSVPLIPSTYNMKVSPSLDVPMYPIADFDENDSIYSPGMTISQEYPNGFTNIGTDEWHIVVGAYGGYTTESPFVSNFGAVFGISTGVSTAEPPVTPTDEVGAGLRAFVDSTQLWNGSRAAVVAEVYGDIVKISTMTTSTDITVSGTNIDLTGFYGDHKTVINYGSGYVEGEGGIQKGTIAWTDATVSAATLGGGKAGDLVFKFD